MPNATAAGEQLAEPDYAMHANAQLLDRGPRYTETPPDPYSPDAPFVAEPWNAVTATLFVWIVVYWVVRLRGRYRSHPFMMACLPVLLVGGVGGTLYHGLRTDRLYFYLDVVPIQFLALAGAVYAGYVAIRLRLRRYTRSTAAVVTLATTFLLLGLYLGTSALLFTVVLPRSRQLAVNLNYAALATMIVVPMLAMLIQTRFRHGGWVAAGLVAFVIAWFFRLLDERVGLYLPMGSHWLWHTFGAAATGLVIEFYYLVERDGIPPTPAEPATEPADPGW